MFMGLVAQNGRGQVFKVLFGSASLVTVLRYAALLETPVRGDWTGVTQKQQLEWEGLRTTPLPATPLPVPPLSWGHPALSLGVLQWQSCYLHTPSPLALKALEKGLCHSDSVGSRDVKMDTGGNSFSDAYRYYTTDFHSTCWQPGSGSGSLLGLGRLSHAPDMPWHVPSFLSAF